MVDLKKSFTATFKIETLMNSNCLQSSVGITAINLISTTCSNK